MRDVIVVNCSAVGYVVDFSAGTVTETAILAAGGVAKFDGVAVDVADAEYTVTIRRGTRSVKSIQTPGREMSARHWVLSYCDCHSDDNDSNSR